MNAGQLVAIGIRFISVYIAWTGFNALRNGGFLYAVRNDYYEQRNWFFPDQKIADGWEDMVTTAWQPYLTYSLIAFIASGVLWYFSSKLAVLFTKGLPEKALQPASTAITKLSISRDGVEIGEWPDEQVRTLYKEGQLLPTDYYWKEGMAEWTELSRLIEPPVPPKSPPEEVPVSAKSLSVVVTEHAAEPDSMLAGENAKPAQDYGINTISFHVGAFLLPFLFLLHFKKQKWAWTYFVVHAFANATKSGALLLCLEIPVMTAMGIYGNKVLLESNIIVTQKAYNWSYGKWLAAGIIINGLIFAAFYMMSLQNNR